ncbi:hypothetical protein EVAR_16259_1 [Eumeta japonica]|uniref:Uncharacterized protein n=1 Tax=Eumeta variegata TaxID=151549 RepID=A0A4C1U613_EUMVA|nr:hypothetical protein EVAR_16259_1 [Eumeta japonica]
MEVQEAQARIIKSLEFPAEAPDANRVRVDVVSLNYGQIALWNIELRSIYPPKRTGANIKRVATSLVDNYGLLVARFTNSSSFPYIYLTEKLSKINLHVQATERQGRRRRGGRLGRKTTRLAD